MSDSDSGFDSGSGTAIAVAIAAEDAIASVAVGAPDPGARGLEGMLGTWEPVAVEVGTGPHPDGLSHEAIGWDSDLGWRMHLRARRTEDQAKKKWVRIHSMASKPPSLLCIACMTKNELHGPRLSLGLVGTKIVFLLTPSGAGLFSPQLFLMCASMFDII